MTSVLKSLLLFSLNSSSSKLRKVYTYHLSKSLLVLNSSENERRFQHSKTIKCWKCGIEKQNIDELFCQKCNIIQNPGDKNNYFKLLQCNESFDIDLKTLRERYRKMQSVLHPDRFSNRSMEEKHISVDFSSLINKAYDILQSPLKRAVHLLALKGEQMREDDKIEDPKYLMEIMELNEEVESASSPEKLKELNQLNKKTMDYIQQEISDAFKENNLKTVKYSIIKLRYFNSVSLHVNNLLREKGIVD